MSSRDAILDRLRQLSEERGLTGAELGRVLGMTRSMGALLLRGESRTPFEKMESWATHLGHRVVATVVPVESAPVIEELLLLLKQADRHSIARLLRFARVAQGADDTWLAVWDSELLIHERRRDEVRLSQSRDRRTN